jgi:predicted RecA/RadA family phage recombinase
MRNYVSSGDYLVVTAPRTVTSGEGVLVGSIFGVAEDGATSGDTDLVIETEGVFDLAKTSAQAWTAGAKVYWDNTNFRCDSDSTVGQFVGHATAAAANPSSTGRVRLASPGSLSEGAQAAIVSLTDSTGGSGTHDDTLADGLTSVAPDAFTSPLAGAVPVTSNAATDLTTVVGPAVANLRGVVATLVTDMTVTNQNVSDLAQKVLEILTALRNAGIITT